MSGHPRAGEWHLLGVDSDPLPGNADLVDDERTTFSETATAIRDQVARLRQMASGNNELVGKYAPALEEAAQDLADHLDDTEGRFDTVAAQLTIWSPVLADGMTQTATMVKEAEDAQHAIDSNQPSGTPVDPKDDKAVTADKQRGNRLSGAQGDLGDVQGRFNTLMSHVNDVADSVAKKISDAADDGLKDSWWDKHVRKWIHDHADLLKMIADVLTWIATIVIVAIVLLSNPAGWLILVAMIATGLALAIHTALAANGDGSWTDVALDAFALVTMGAGELLSSGARGALALKEGSVAFSDTVSTARAAFGEASGFFGRTGAWLGKSNIVARNLRGAYAGLSEFSTVMNKAFEGGSLLNRLSMGSKEAAGLYNAITESIGRNGPGFLLHSADVMMQTVRPVFLSGVGVDVIAKTLNPAFPQFWGDGSPIKPAITQWSHWAEEHTVPHGGFW